MIELIAFIAGVLTGIGLMWLIGRDDKDSDRIDFLNSGFCDLVYLPESSKWGILDRHKKFLASGMDLRKVVDLAMKKS